MLQTISDARLEQALATSERLPRARHPLRLRELVGAAIMSGLYLLICY